LDGMNGNCQVRVRGRKGARMKGLIRGGRTEKRVKKKEREWGGGKNEEEARNPETKKRKWKSILMIHTRKWQETQDKWTKKDQGRGLAVKGKRGEDKKVRGRTVTEPSEKEGVWKE